MRILYAIELAVFFIKELILANVQVALCVIKPNRKLKPAIISIPLSLKTDLGITVLANLITLTPGTLTLEVSKDKKAIFVHVIDTTDPLSVKTSIKNGFEKRIKRTFE